MTDKILHWGLLSTARINARLIPALNASKRNRLAAVASRSQATADVYAREWKIPRALGSYEALLNDSEIDVIYNPLPNSFHAEWTIKALRAGKHVLCEKPMALTLAELDAMAKASKERPSCCAGGVHVPPSSADVEGQRAGDWRFTWKVAIGQRLVYLYADA